MGSAAQGAGTPGEPPEQATAEMPPVGGATPHGESPADAHAASGGPDTFAERPELFVGGAFAGGLIIAQLIRRLGR
jgi:hypothetical protein